MDRNHPEFITQLNRAVDEWTARAIAHAEAAEAYRLAHAQATTASQAKTDAARRADADAATTTQRLARERAEIARDAAYHRMIGLRGSAGERQQ
jgi:molecular chaperone GrpE (heat shock protein)